MRITLEVLSKYRFDYHFEIGARTGGGYAVQREECIWQGLKDPAEHGEFSVRNGVVAQSSVKTPPPAANDRLYLVTIAGHPGFEPLYKALSTMGFYNLNPDRIRDLQSPDSGELMARNGDNLTAVFANLTRTEPGRAERVIEFLSLVVPGIETVTTRALGPKETLEFRERSEGDERARKFLAASMSDGTLRALGVLVALFQRSTGRGAVSLVGIEEPEMALHPAAAGVLLDSLREASLRRQVLVTSHSPDLLDRSDIAVESILAVSSKDGKTYIGPVNEAGKKILQKKLRTAGELMRINQMEPDWAKIPGTSTLQLRLFH